MPRSIVGFIVALVVLCAPASALATAADGSGTISVSPTYVVNGSTGNYLTFTYTAAAGGISNGEIDVAVPAGWTTPDANGFNAGGSNADCGTLAVVGSTMKVTGVTMSGGAVCNIRYGLSGFNAGDTAPAATGTNIFTTHEKSTSGGVLTSVSVQPAVVVGTDGTGTMTASPSVARVSTTGNTETFHYVASRTIANGAITVFVPVDWSTPSTNPAAAGYTTTTCSGGTVSIAGATIHVTGISMSSGASCDVVYGSKASGGPGATAPSTGGTETFTTQQESTNDNNLQALPSSPGVTVVANDGTGTVTVSPTYVITGSTGNDLTFTYTAANGGLTNGEITIAVPAGWTTPDANGFNAGGSNADCGTLSVVGSTMHVTGITLAGGGTCSIRYGLNGFNAGDTAPNAAGTSTFTTQERSHAGGVLTSVAGQPSVLVADDGTGTLAVAPSSVLVSSSGKTLVFTYTAARAISSGALAVTVPAGWSVPSTTSNQPGYTTTTCSGGSVSIATRTINVTGISMANAATCTVTYGSKTAGGPGATAPSSGGINTFATQQRSSAGGTLTNLASGSPTVSVVAADGTGTISVAPNRVVTGSTGNDLTFTYTAANGGLDNGEITIAVPAGWTTPDANGFNAGGTNADCGTVSVVGSTIHVTGVTLAGGAQCNIRYGLQGFNAGDTAPNANTTSTFTTQERSIASGALTSVAGSPQVIVNSDGTGTVAVAPSSVLVNSSGKTLVFTFTAGATVTSGALAITIPAGWSTPATSGLLSGYTTTNCSGGSVSIATRTINVTGMSVANGASCTVTYGSKAAGGAGATAPSSGGTNTFTTQEKSTAGGALADIASFPALQVVAADGTGTMTVSPSTVVPGSTGNDLTFTYTAANGGLSNGEITVAVPAGWTTPDANGFNAGGSNADCGTVSVVGSAIHVTGATVAGGGQCNIRYGLSGFNAGVTAPNAAGNATFAAQERSIASGVLTSLASSPHVIVGADGSGTMGVAPSTFSAASTGNTLTLTYTSVGVSNGQLNVAVPAGWSAPSTTGSAPGYTTSTCGTVAAAGSTIQVTGVTVPAASTCTITYGSTQAGGPGATAPAATGPATLTTQSKATSGGTLTTLNAGSPQITVFAADGSGTLSADTPIVGAGSDGNTIVFTYTAAAGGVNSGEIDLAVPATWTTPSTTGSNSGFSSSTCGGVAITGNTIRVTGVSLGGGGTCAITYGSKASGGAGVTAPASSGSSVFGGQERSTGGGTLLDIASSPQVATTAPDGSGAAGVSPATVTTDSQNAFVVTYTAATGGMSNGEIALAPPGSLAAPSTIGSDPGYTTSTCGSVAVPSGVAKITGVSLAGGATCTITYGSQAAGGPGVTAPSAPATLTLALMQKSSSNGALTDLASSPQVAVTAPAPVGTPAPAPGGGADTVPPTPPGKLAGRIRHRKLMLSWAPSTDDSGKVSYRVLRNGKAIHSVAAPAVALTPAAGTYAVIALDAAGNHSPAVTVKVRRKPRPKGVPRHVPSWAPKLLAGKPAHAPKPLPAWYAKYKAWRLFGFTITG